MKKKLLVLCLWILCLGMSACSSNKEEKTTTNKGEEVATVNIAISNEGKADQLDATSYNASMALYSAIYEPLVEYGEKGEFQPGLAESWEISDDGKSYTFHLKSGVKFSDGSNVNAEAVKFTIERSKVMNEETSVQTLKNLDKVEVVDDNTVRFIFTEISSQVLNELCQTRPLRIMSPNSVEGNKTDGEFKEAIGSGPFIVTESDAEKTVMEPNPYYNESTPVKYDVTFKTIQDASSRTLALKSGEIDIVGGTLGSISDEDLQVLAKDKNYKVYEFTGTMSHFLAFNPDNSNLTESVRRAIESAIDKKHLSDKDLVGLFQPDVQYVTSGNQTVVPYNVEETQNILEKEGYKKNDAGFYENSEGELSFNLVIQTTEFPEWKAKAELIESDLKKAGIKVNIQISDMESYYDALWKTKEFDLIFYRSYTDALLPYYFLTSLFQNNDKGHGILANDEELTTMLTDFGQLIDTEKQQDQFDKIFKRISDQTLAVPIEYKDEVFATSSKIKELNYSGLSDAAINYKKLVVN